MGLSRKMGSTGAEEMIHSVWWSDKAKGVTNQEIANFMNFVQRMANRIIVGHLRYGTPKREQQYMSRAFAELRAYKKTGNMEQLYNVANYCWLESIAPENKKFHFDDTVDSVTRGKFIHG